MTRKIRSAAGTVGGQAAEKRRQDYVDGLRQKLFGPARTGFEESPDSVLRLPETRPVMIGTMALDIDNDGVREDCTMTYGPTSGLFTVVITASADGRIKYKNTFRLASGEISFAELDGAAQFVRDGEYHRMYVEEGRIVIENLDPQVESYWGDSEWNYDLKPEREEPSSPGA